MKNKIVKMIYPSSPNVDASIVTAYSGAIVVDIVVLNVVNKLSWSEVSPLTTI